MDLKQLLRILQFPAPIEEAVTREIQANGPTTASLANDAYRAEEYEFPIRKLPPLQRLAVMISLLIDTYGKHAQRAVPETIIAETFRDVSLRAVLYYPKHRQPGLSEADVIWFRRIIHIPIFKVGSMQFQPFSKIYPDEAYLGEPYMVFSEEQKRQLPPEVLSSTVTFQRVQTCERNVWPLPFLRQSPVS